MNSSKGMKSCVQERISISWRIRWPITIYKKEINFTPIFKSNNIIWHQSYTVTDQTANLPPTVRNVFNLLMNPCMIYPDTQAVVMLWSTLHCNTDHLMMPDMHFTWSSRRDGVFSHELTMVTSWRKPISPGKPCEMHFLPCYITYLAQTNRFAITTNRQQLPF